MNGGDSLPMQADLDTFKAEIIREMRNEISKAKQEIIDGMFIRCIYCDFCLVLFIHPGTFSCLSLKLKFI